MEAAFIESPPEPALSCMWTLDVHGCLTCGAMFAADPAPHGEIRNDKSASVDQLPCRKRMRFPSTIHSSPDGFRLANAVVNRRR